MYAASFIINGWNVISAFLFTESGFTIRIVELRLPPGLLKLWSKPVVRAALERILLNSGGRSTRLKLENQIEEKGRVLADAYICYRQTKKSRQQYISVSRMLFCDLASRSPYRVWSVLGLTVFQIEQNKVLLSTFTNPEGTSLLRSFLTQLDANSLPHHCEKMLRLNQSRLTMSGAEMNRLDHFTQIVHKKKITGNASTR
jgi:hypothetical protein